MTFCGFEGTSPPLPPPPPKRKWWHIHRWRSPGGGWPYRCRCGIDFNQWEMWK